MEIIKFNENLIDSIRKGRKTVTRRKARELVGIDDTLCRYVDGDIQVHMGYPIGHVSIYNRCPYKVGQILRVDGTNMAIRITKIEAQRLHEINGQGHHDDVLKEGYPFGVDLSKPHLPPLALFKDLWESTVEEYEKDVYGWDANPWVWVLDFVKEDYAYTHSRMRQ